jgi:hypothetical protein
MKNVRKFGGLSSGVLALFAMACSPPKVTQQRLVNQRNMTFSTSAVWRQGPRQLTQIETGLNAAGGGQSAGCTSCK